MTALNQQEKEAFLSGLHVGVLSIPPKWTGPSDRAHLVRLRPWREPLGDDRPRLAQGRAA